MGSFRGSGLAGLGGGGDEEEGLPAAENGHEAVGPDFGNRLGGGRILHDDWRGDEAEDIAGGDGGVGGACERGQGDGESGEEAEGDSFSIHRGLNTRGVFLVAGDFCRNQQNWGRNLGEGKFDRTDRMNRMEKEMMIQF